MNSIESELKSAQKKPYKLKGDMGGEWNYGSELLVDLVEGKMSLLDAKLQRNYLDWQMTDNVNVFRNKEDGTIVTAQVPKRGNKAYAVVNSKKLDSLLEKFDELEFDTPARGYPSNYRYTRILFFTLTFSNKRYTREESWAMLRSTMPDEVDFDCGVLNKFGARISKIFGKNGKLACKEANSSGYAAPHVVVVLDRPVLVKRHVGKDGSVTWRIADKRILCRIGKDLNSRRRSMYDVEAAVKDNPLWSYGEMDVQAVVKRDKFGKFSNVFTYIWKYLTKTADTSRYPEINEMDSISDCENESLRTMCFTNLGNKSFRTRTMVIGKAFKERLGLLPVEKPSDSRWERIVSIPQWYGEIIQPAIDRHNEKILNQ